MGTLKTLSINLFILSVCMLIIEVIFGNWLSPNRLNQLNILKKVKIIFDVSKLYENATGQSYYKRDEYGLRGKYNGLKNIDILTIGGSTTDQRFISEGDTWQDVIAEDFKKHDFPITVVNAGIDGQSIYGHIKNFEWWFPEIPLLKPKYILCYIGVNDILKDAYYHYDQLRQPSDFALKVLIKERSALYYLFRTLRGIYLASFVHKISHRSIEFEKQQWTDKALLANHKKLLQAHLESYKKRLIKLVHKIEQFGSTPILVTQTSRKFKHSHGRLLGVSQIITYKGEKINGVDYYYMLRLMNLMTINIAKKLNIFHIDLGQEIKLEDDDFYDFFHTTPKGSRKIGLYLSNKLIPFFKAAPL